ncbi:hypothetical protein MKW94_012609 [Papaver nudicaule]|uniref:HSF-type DNA-binding domain-containing protein n=1 Tax=Papaver nudicaule TaxID=74823 RepID=A0AA41RSJ6_PAPNU|nr:hypothetical protein [Papaver nudicaule]
MGKSKGDNKDGQLPPFLVKCYDMVDDASTNSIISWCDSNDSFKIHDMIRFQKELLSKYFKHSNFSSFMRQLNTYGFRKLDPDQFIFGNEKFVKGKKQLLKDISRRKKSQEQIGKELEQQTNNKAPVVPPCIYKVEILKGMEINQQQMLSLLVMAMQNPRFLSQLVQQKENNWRMADTRKKRRLPAPVQGNEHVEPEVFEGQIVKYQPLATESQTSLPAPVLGNAEFEQSEPAPIEEDDFFNNIDFTQFVEHLPLPDVPEDLMEQLLSIASPRLQEIDDMEMELYTQNLENQLEIESDNLDAGVEAVENLDLLTEKMGLLAPNEKYMSESP